MLGKGVANKCHCVKYPSSFFLLRSPTGGAPGSPCRRDSSAWCHGQRITGRDIGRAEKRETISLMPATKGANV